MIGNDLALAADFLRQGKVIGIPTETVYGLAANALDENAVLSIFKIKNRPYFDPLIIHLPDIQSVKKYVIDFPEKAVHLAETYWPGPLSLLLPKNNLIPDLVTSGSPYVAVRIPNNPLTLSLLKSLDFPLAAPSANPFGYISPTRATHVADQLGDKIPYILDGGECRVGLESSIVDFTGESPRLLRLGGLSVNDIEETLGNKLLLNISQNSNPQAPGQLDKHYAPKTPFVVSDNLENDILRHKNKKIAVLGFGQFQIPEHVYSMNLSQIGSLEEASRNLFHYMRLLDNQGFDVILSMKVPEIGLGRAINDRIYRASVK